MKIDVGDTLVYIGYGKSSFYRVVGYTPANFYKGEILDVQAFSNRKCYLSISPEVCKIKPIAYLQPRKPGWYLL
jgi:hypothetical protein